jgi:TRAP-type C4-dicarboxylate transport system permease small subunit
VRVFQISEIAITVLSRLAAALGALCGLVCFLLVCVSVAWRYFLGAPQPWIDHVAAWLVVALVMLAAAETQRRREHIGVEVVTGRLRGVARRAAHILGTASVAAVAAILLHEGLETVAFSRMIGIATNIEAVPLWWVQLLIPLGAGLLLAVAIVQLVQLFAGIEPKGAAPGDAQSLPGRE